MHGVCTYLFRIMRSSDHNSDGLAFEAHTSEGGEDAHAKKNGLEEESPRVDRASAGYKEFNIVIGAHLFLNPAVPYWKSCCF